jgi:hypothetical protein
LPSASRASLEDDAARLREGLRGAEEIHVSEPLLLERGRVRPLLVPLAAMNPTSKACASVTIIGARTASFAARVPASGTAHAGRADEVPLSSSAGLIEMRRCGAEKALFGSMAIEMRSPRAVLRVVSAVSKAPLPSIASVLPDRQAGPAAPMTRPGPRPYSAPIADRLKSMEARARREGAVETDQRVLPLGSEGAAEASVELAPGCHRIDALAEPLIHGGPRTLDLDLYVMDARGGIVAGDASDNADARVSFCSAQPALLRLRVVGGAPGSQVTIHRSRTLLPLGVPTSWGPLAEVRIAQVLNRHQVRSLEGPPVYASIGINGVTRLPIEVEPGACYVVAMAAIHGELSALGLALLNGGSTMARDRSGEDGSALLAFCAEDQERSLIEVEAHGRSLVWLLGLWPTGTVALGEEVP